MTVEPLAVIVGVTGEAVTVIVIGADVAAQAPLPTVTV